MTVVALFKAERATVDDIAFQLDEQLGCDPLESGHALAASRSRRWFL